jgi:hypothetical protein
MDKQKRKSDDCWTQHKFDPLKEKEMLRMRLRGIMWKRGYKGIKK